MWQKSIRLAKTSQNKSKHLLFYSLNCSRGWGKIEGQELSNSSLRVFFLDVFIQHLAKTEHRDQKISTALLGIIHFCNRSPSFHPNQMVLQPLGREYSAKQKKCEFAAASSTAKGSLTDETLPSQLLQALCSQPVQHLPDTHERLLDADGLSKGVIRHHWNTHQRSLCH